ncbi:retrovirus-related gag-pol polyprotein, partial [Lasius niger]
MEGAKPVSTPIEKSVLTEEVASTELTAAPYREAVGCLMYLAVATRLDISFAVNYVSQFLEKPEEKHWTMVKRILRYIKGTAAMGIRYEANRRAYQLEGYSDANYASDPNSRKSVSGILFKYSGGAI